MNKPAKGGPNWGSFALVTYLPDPLGSFLTEVRQWLPGDDHPEAHITFLPPRPLAVPVEEASREITRLLRLVRPFELELGCVRTFSETGMLYLSVAAGCEELRGLHDGLNCGKLFAREHFDYVPHLTLCGPLADCELEAARAQATEAWDASEHARNFVVNEMVLLWQAGACSEKAWRRVASYPLMAGARNGASKTAATPTRA